MFSSLQELRHTISACLILYPVRTNCTTSIEKTHKVILGHFGMEKVVMVFTEFQKNVDHLILPLIWAE